MLVLNLWLKLYSVALSRRGNVVAAVDWARQCSLFKVACVLTGFFDCFRPFEIASSVQLHSWVAPIIVAWGRCDTRSIMFMCFVVMARYIMFAWPYGSCRGVFGSCTSLRVIGIGFQREDVINLRSPWLTPIYRELIMKVHRIELRVLSVVLCSAR